jgi:hypothetical protein
LPYLRNVLHFCSGEQWEGNVHSSSKVSQILLVSRLLNTSKPRTNAGNSWVSHLQVGKLLLDLSLRSRALNGGTLGELLEVCG